MTWTLEEEARYEQFVAGLTALSRKYGIAAAAAIVLFLFILAFTMVQLFVQRKWVNRR